MNWNMSDNEPAIRKEMLERIDSIEEFDANVSKELMEAMHHSELARIFENADERDILTVCYVAVRRFPIKYLTVLMDYMLEKEDEHGNDVFRDIHRNDLGCSDNSGIVDS